MAFFLYSQPTSTALLGSLKTLILKEQQTSIFKEVKLILAENTHRTHLHLNLVRLNGFSANLKFYNLNTWLFEFWQSFKNCQHVNFFEKNYVSWVIFSLLKKQKIKTYAKFSDDILDDLGLYNLAEYTADVLWQMMEYRALHLKHKKHSNYQDVLDNHLKKDNFLTQLDILNELSKPSLKLKITPHFKMVILWGFSRLSPLWIRLIKILSSKIDFHFFLLNPSNSYWIEKDSDSLNSSLNLLNELAINQKILLRNMIEADLINDFGNITSANNDGSQLGILKYSLQTPENSNATTDEARRNVKPELTPLIGQNLQIVRCNDPYQEVYLLKETLQKYCMLNKDIANSEILILATDLNTYLTPLKTIFGLSPQEIPYFIRNMSPKDRNLGSDFWDLCQFLSGTVEAKDMFFLLKKETVQQNFNLDDNKVEQIQSLFQELRAAWGIADSNFNLPHLDNLPDNSLDKIVLSIAISFFFGPKTKQNSIWEDLQLVPIQINFDNFYEVFEDFLRFFLLLHKWTSDKQHVLCKKRTFKAWHQTLYQIAQDFFGPGWKIEEKIAPLLTPLIAADLKSLDEHKIGWDLVSFMLQKKLTQDNKSFAQQNFSHNGIKFMELKSYSDFPAKVVFLLGANRHLLPDDFKDNLLFELSHSKQPGDPSYLADIHAKIVSLVLQSEKYLQISYLGYKESENSAIAPAFFVEALKKWGRSHLDIELEIDATTKQRQLNLTSPTQSLNIINNQQTKKITSSPDSKPLQTEIAINDLVSFWQNPLLYFAKHIAKIDIHQPRPKFDSGDFRQQKKPQNRILKKMASYLLQAGNNQLSNDNIYWRFKNFFSEGAQGKNDFQKTLAAAQQLSTELMLLGNYFEEKNIIVKHTLKRQNTQNITLYGNIVCLRFSGNDKYFQIMGVPDWHSLISGYINFLCFKLIFKSDFLVAGWNNKEDLLKKSPKIFKYQVDQGKSVTSLLNELIAVFHQGRINPPILVKHLIEEFLQAKLSKRKTQKKDYWESFSQWQKKIKKPLRSDYPKQTTEKERDRWANYFYRDYFLTIDPNTPKNPDYPLASFDDSMLGIKLLENINLVEVDQSSIIN